MISSIHNNRLQDQSQRDFMTTWRITCWLKYLGHSLHNKVWIQYRYVLWNSFFIASYRQHSDCVHLRVFSIAHIWSGFHILAAFPLSCPSKTRQVLALLRGLSSRQRCCLTYWSSLAWTNLTMNGGQAQWYLGNFCILCLKCFFLSAVWPWSGHTSKTDPHSTRWLKWIDASLIALLKCCCPFVMCVRRCFYSRNGLLPEPTAQALVLRSLETALYSARHVYEHKSSF